MGRIAALCALGVGCVLALGGLSEAARGTLPTGNLVQNPGAESVTGTGGRMKPTGWRTDAGFGALAYADAGPFIVGTADKPDPPRGAPSSGGSGGSNYFSGPACRTAGCADNPYNNLGSALDNSGSQASQSVSVAGAAREIDAGGVKATLAAQMGGYRGQATVTATFLDGGGARLGAITLGPVTSDAMTSRSSTQAVPAKTRTIQIVLAERRVEQSVPGYGFFDNISLTLSGGAGADPIEGGWIFDQNVVTVASGTAGRFLGTVTKAHPGSCPYHVGDKIWNITRKGADRYAGTYTCLFHKGAGSRDPVYPTAWNLFRTAKALILRMCVTAKDRHKVCETLQRAGAVVKDTTSPRVKALASSGRAGKWVRLRFRVVDDSGEAYGAFAIYRGSKVLVRFKSLWDLALVGRTSYWLWKAPSSAVGRLRFCVRSFDRAGHAGNTACAPLRVRR